MRRFSPRLPLAALSLLGLGATLGAQQMACPPGKVVVPYFGWDATECGDCRVFGSYLEYLKEPRIRDIRSPGPAEGKLRDEDTIVAVDGTPITSPTAWQTLRDASPRAPIQFTVRRDGALVSATITPGARCGTPERERHEPGSIIVIVRRPT